MRILVIGITLMLSIQLFAQQAKILQIENVVEASQGQLGWRPGAVGQSLAVKDRVRTRLRSRALVRVNDLYTMRMDQFTTVEISPRLTSIKKPTLNVVKGVTFLFSREKEGEIEITTPTANAALRGTQLVVEVLKNGTTRIAVLEGKVDLSNKWGGIQLTAGESGEARKGKAPRKTAVIKAKNLVQWALYYPGILDAQTLGLENNARLAPSLAAYRQGDLPTALEKLPARSGPTAGEKLYQAQVLLAVGRVDDAFVELRALSKRDVKRRALERLIEAVTLVPSGKRGDPHGSRLLVAGDQTAEWALAESYYQQACHNLKGAREKARLAVRLAPKNGYAWVRLAELEFSFGENVKAEDCLKKAFLLTPRNAQAHALKGFLLAARNRPDSARRSFQQSLAIDGALGNAWLGLGLMKIRGGDLEAGRVDIQTAATAEPTRSMFHSYLGKAFGEDGKSHLAAKDLALARRLDPMDPTPWLYSALEHQRRNQPNRAILDLGESLRLNDNRRVYRSQLLLDQDRAVRSANLAKMYQNAGLTDVAVREATRAVESDYTNASAHLFLANSFDALRDPRRVSLRYETPWFNELLLANLLSPVGGGPLSQFVSQQEYSKFFTADGLGGSLMGEWRSDGEVFTTTSIFGSHRNVEFGLDINYRHATGTRRNNQSELLEIYAQGKWEATPNDIVYLLGKWQEQSAGDNFQIFDNKPLEPFVDFEENQSPGLLLAGWNHRWRPGVHTLFLGGRLSAQQTLRNPQANLLKVERSPTGLVPGFANLSGGQVKFTDPALQAEVQQANLNGTPAPGRISADGQSLNLTPTLHNAIAPFLGSGTPLLASLSSFDLETRRQFEINSAEIQQVFQTDRNTLLFGGRLQSGEIESKSRLLYNQGGGILEGFGSPAAQQNYRYKFRRYNAYVYDYWKVSDCLTLIGGASWDRIDHPSNFRNPPLSGDSRTDDRLSGKAGFTYSPGTWLTVRGMFSQGLGGVSFDESVRLEPVQLAGFNQAYRTVISESLVGSVETPEFNIWGLSFEGQLPTNTWWGISASGISQKVSRETGIFTGYSLGSLFDANPAFFPDSMREELDYEELALSVTLNQLIGDEFSVGARYRVTRSELTRRFPELSGSGLINDTKNAATLHEASLFADWNSPTGLFAHLEVNGYWQRLDDDPQIVGGSRKGDSFIQVNTSLGYRFDDNNAEISVAVLNLFDSDYQLSPLNPHTSLPRERTFVVRCRWNF